MEDESDEHDYDHSYIFYIQRFYVITYAYLFICLQKIKK